MVEKNVIVIGAGAAGLVAAKHLCSCKEFRATVYEQTGQVGGTWVYTDRVGVDQNGYPIHSSMYKNMRTNLPKEIMGFLDYPFNSSDQSFIHHSQVLRYLESYAEHFNLYKVIQFYRHVKQIRPLNIDGKVTWEVISTEVRDPEQSERRELFDAVMVCNGHFSQPSEAKIQDLEKFEGTIIHSHDYREPEQFAGKSVVCQGAGPSGIDIALELSAVSHRIFLSETSGKKMSSLPTNVEMIGRIERAVKDGFVLSSGQQCKAEALIVCTGYDYTFPFLHKDCGITITDNKMVTPVYKHVVNINYPTMGIIGIPFTVLPFRLMDIQSRFFLRTLDPYCPVKLPSREEMLSDMHSDRERRHEKGVPLRHTHKLADEQWAYGEDLIRIGRLQDSVKLPPVVKMVYDAVHDLRQKNVANYKNVNFSLSGPDSFRCDAL